MGEEGGKCGAASGQIADPDMDQIHRKQASLRAEHHRFVVGWELKEWLAAEQEWFANSRKT